MRKGRKEDRFGDVLIHVAHKARRQFNHRSTIPLMLSFVLAQCPGTKLSHPHLPSSLVLSVYPLYSTPEVTPPLKPQSKSRKSSTPPVPTEEKPKWLKLYITSFAYHHHAYEEEQAASVMSPPSTDLAPPKVSCSSCTPAHPHTERPYQPDSACSLRRLRPFEARLCRNQRTGVRCHAEEGDIRERCRLQRFCRQGRQQGLGCASASVRFRTVC